MNKVSGWAIVRWRETGKTTPAVDNDGNSIMVNETVFGEIIDVCSDRQDAVRYSTEYNMQTPFGSPISYSVLPYAEALELEKIRDAKPALTAATVEEVFVYCLFEKGEDTTNAVVANGVSMKTGFHPGRLAEKKSTIVSFLNELPKQFHQNTGGGWSFLNACVTSTEKQWGEHLDVEKLMLLGIAIDKVYYTLPREMWWMLPGNMAYFTIRD